MLDENESTIAVIGCGNPNRRDDGIGSAVIAALKRRGACGSGRVRLLDTGTDGMAVMFGARGCGTLIVIDACRSGSPPGSIFEVPGTELEQRYEPSVTLHDFRWDHALFVARRIFAAEFPREVIVFLVEAETVEFGIRLSGAVAEAAALVASRVQEIVEQRLEQERIGGPNASIPCGVSS
jgi:hydrogenase maturation protease